jgi:hypothetical protein
MGDSPIKVIALDPGGTTGWAKGLIRDYKMHAISGQDKWNHLELYNAIELFKPDIIICERFDYRKGGKKQVGVELISREYIGVVELYVQMRDAEFKAGSGYFVQLYMQMPTEALGGYWKEDSKLKEDNMFMIGKPHANDAMRHLLQWYSFKQGFVYNKHGFARLDEND